MSIAAQARGRRIDVSMSVNPKQGRLGLRCQVAVDCAETDRMIAAKCQAHSAFFYNSAYALRQLLMSTS